MNARALALICLVAFSLAAHAGPKVLPLALGATNAGTIALPGQHDRFTFHGSLGQRLCYDALDLDYENINVALYAPSGALVPSFPRNQSSDFGPFFLPETGTYSVLVNGGGDAVGNYRFRFLDAGNGTLLGYGTNVIGQLDPQSATVAYRFNGTAGQRISVTNISASSGNATWRLIGPVDHGFFNLNITTTPGEFVLPIPGSYLLLVEGAVDSIGVLDYVFRVNLISNPSGGTSGFGTIRRGTTTVGQTNLFTYTAPAGAVVFFDSLTNTSTATICLYDPAGEQVFCTDGNGNAGPFVLPRSGNYRLEVVGYGVGPFNFQLLEGSAAPAITFGTTYGQTIAVPFRSDLRRFTGSVGQRLSYDALGPDGDAVSLRVVHPNGGDIFINTGNAGSDGDPFTITQPGTYYLIVESSDDDPTLDYSFRLIDMAQSPATALTPGATINGMLNPGTRTDWYRFSGTAGQRVYFDGAGTNTTGNFFLYGPQDQGLNGNGLGSDFEHLLRQTGTYLVAVFHNFGETNALPYSFRAVLGTSTTNALTLGAVVTGAVAQVGQEFRYTFSGATGQRLFYDALDSDADSLRVFLLNPNGGIVLIDGSAENDAGPYTLAETGSYTLVIRGYGIATGPYRFRLFDMSLPPVETLSLNTTINGVLDPGTEVNWYRITGTAGQRLYFAGAETNTAGNWFIYGPDNGGLNGNSLGGDFELVFSVTGTHLLAVYQSGNTNALPYSMRVSTPATNVLALVFGTSYSNLIAAVGDEHRYTFTGAAGQRLFYDALESDFDSISVYLLDSSGGFVQLNGNADSDAGIFTLQHSGAYTLVLRGLNDTTGDYRFKLLDLASAPAVTYGTTVTAQLSPHFETDLYRINGTTGQRLLITNLAASGNNANWYFFRPDNNTLLAQSIENSLGEIVLPVTGTYALGIVGNADPAATLDYQFRVSLLSSSNGTPAGFGVVRSGSTTFDQTNNYAYTGTSGLPIYFDNLTNTTAAVYQLVAPDGTLVFNFQSGSDSGPYFLPTNGAYTLKVIGIEAGAFRFQLVNLTSASVSNLVFGTTHRNTMSPGFRTDIYRFTGTAGQRLVYDGLDYEFEGITIRLYNPVGDNVIIVNQNSDHDIGPFTLTQPGTYYLALESQTEDPVANYSFRLLDAAQAPATVLALDTQINGTLNPGTRFDVYRFNGTAGQRLYFDAMPTNSAPDWTLYGPHDQVLGGNILYGDFELALPLTGQYLLLAGFGTDTNPTPYSVRVVTPTDATNALTIGGTVSGVLIEPGESDYYTFPGTVGQRLYYDALQYDSDGINVQLIDPVGNVVFDHNTDSEAEPITLTYSGIHLARIYSGTDPIGSYSFRFLDAAVAPLIAYDNVLTNNLTNFSAALYRVPIVPGLRLFFDNLAAPDGNGYQQLYDLDNVPLAGTYAGNDFETTPTLAGTHLLVINSIVTTPIPYSVRIIPGNHPPVLAIGPRVINEETNSSFTATTTDVELPNDVLTWSLDAGAPAGTAIDPVTGVFSWTPTELQGSNTYTVTVRVRDDSIPQFEDFETFTITVNEVNSAPTLQLPPTQTINELTALNVTLGGNDLDVPTNALAFALVSGPVGLTVSALGVVNWTPQENHGPGTHPVTVRVFDTNSLAANARSLSTTGTFNVVVNEINLPPTITGPANNTIVEELPHLVTPTATDPDLPANSLVFSLISGPPGLSLDGTGNIAWTPTETQGPGDYAVTLRVTDHSPVAVNAQQLSATNTFTFTVRESNRAPSLAVPATQTLLEETLLSVTATATDPDLPTNALTIELVSGPAGLSVTTNGAITWTPSEAQGSNTYPVILRVIDNNVDAAPNNHQIPVTNFFLIIVLESNKSPVLTVPGPQTILEETLLNVTASATDPDLPTNTLTFALVSGPANLSVSASGALNWTPNEAQGPGTSNIVVRVFDNGSPSLSHTQSFQITVQEVNVAPTLALIPGRAIHVGTLVGLNANASDTDVPTNALTFSLVSPPSGANIGAASGAFTWTPTNSQLGITTLRVRVTDDGSPSLSVTQAFDVRVEPPPLLSSLVLSNSNAHLAWSAITNLAYRAQYNSDLVTSNWSSLAGDVTATSTNAVKVDTTTGGATNRFYRVLVVP